MTQDRQQIIRALFDEYIEMYAARDERLIARFSENFTGYTGSWERLVHDREEWIRITRQDFAQVPGRIHMEVLDLALQDFSADVVGVVAALHINLPAKGELLAREVARLVLVFRREEGTWMIVHCSYSIPFQSTEGDEVFPLSSLQEQNSALQALVAERTEALRESQELYRLLTEDAHDVHWRIDSSFVVTYISPADERMRGFRADEVVGHSVFGMLTEESSTRVRELFSRSTAQETAGSAGRFLKFEVQLCCRDGGLIWGEVLAKPDRNVQGEIIGYHGITRDINERKQLEEQVRQLAFHDTLTRLANRRLLLEHLDQAMSASRRSHRHGAVVFLDLDNFKSLNDTHGHGVGDLLLIEAAARLKDCVRETDSVARFGGDEFVVLLCDLDTQPDDAAAQAAAVAEKIRACLSAPYVLRPTPSGPAIEHHCTASIGVAIFHGRAESPASVIERADAAMYQAKQEGRNRVRLDPRVVES